MQAYHCLCTKEEGRFRSGDTALLLLNYIYQVETYAQARKWYWSPQLQQDTPTCFHHYWRFYTSLYNIRMLDVAGSTSFFETSPFEGDHLDNVRQSRLSHEVPKYRHFENQLLGRPSAMSETTTTVCVSASPEIQAISTLRPPCWNDSWVIPHWSIASATRH